MWTITMKTRTLEMQCQEKQQTMRWKILPTVALFWALLGCPSESYAQSMHNVDDGKTVTEVTQQDSLSKKGLKKTDCFEVLLDDWVKIEPDPDWEDGKKKPWVTGWDWDDGDKDKGTLPEDWSDQTKEKSKSWASFSRQTWVWYSVTGWKALWVNRFVWSGTLFKGKLWEVHITWIADLDDPLHTKWSWKLILWKSLYKWLSFDWDYTFTWAWNNVFRVGMWYSWKLWDWTYGVRIFPLNTNWSPISAKVSFSTKVWKSWSLSSFVFVDFDTKCYYSETEYIHQLAKWVAAFLQARLMWTMDGKFTGVDSQILMWWLKVNL